MASFSQSFHAFVTWPVGTKTCLLLHAPLDYRINRKKCCLPEIALLTVFCPLMTTGAGETALQPVVETRFVLDCKVRPVKLVGQVKMILVPKCTRASPGGGRDNANIVPFPELPPATAFPYRTLVDKIMLPTGETPSLLVKLPKSS